jgi:flavin reductase (DIM6/NTAB) family NADH-FMN oxidoreductase RutF
MAKQIWKGGALTAPVPAVLVSCGTPEQTNVFTVGWTGICATHPPTTYISVRPSRFSYPIILERGAFAINLTTAEQAKTVDFCGVRSGRDTDKMKICGLHAAFCGDVPYLEEAPLSLICRVKQRIELGSHDMFLAEITETAADTRFLDENGKLDLQKAGLMAYAHGEYFALGKPCGTFGFSVRKKNKKRASARKNNK